MDNTVVITGFPGFGSPGKDGSRGIAGKSCFYTDYDLSVDNDFLEVQSRIGNDFTLIKKDNNIKYLRGYFKGDYIIDTNNNLYLINNIDNDNNIIEIISVQNSINNNIFYDGEYLSLYNMALQNNIPSQKDLNNFYSGYPLTLAGNDNSKLLELYDSNNDTSNKSLLISSSSDNIIFDTSNNGIYMSDVYVPKSSNIINSNSIFVILKKVVNNLSIYNDNDKVICDIGEFSNYTNIKITEIIDYVNSDNISSANYSYERIIRNFGEMNNKELKSNNGYIKIYIKDDENNSVFYIANKSDLIRSKLLNIKAAILDDKKPAINVVNNIIDVIIKDNMTKFKIDMEFDNNVYNNNINNISSENITYEISNKTVSIINEITEYSNIKDTVIRSFDIFGVTYYITYKNESYDTNNNAVLDAKFNSYLDNDVKYLQYNSINNGIPCNAFMSVSSLDIKSVSSKELGGNNINIDIKVKIDITNDDNVRILSDENTKFRWSAVLIYPESKTIDITKYLNIEAFNKNTSLISSDIYKTDFSDNIYEFNIASVISKDKIYIGDDSIKLAKYSPKLLILVEFDEPYYCYVKLTTSGSIYDNIDSYEFNENTITNIVPWELTGMSLKKFNEYEDKDVRLYTKVTHAKNPVNLKDLKIEISNYNKRYFRFFDNDKSFYPTNVVNNNIADSVYGELSLLKYGYGLQNSTENIVITPIKSITHNAQSVNYSQFDEDILYPVRTGINVTINRDKINEKELYFNSIPSSGTKYAPTNIDGIVADRTYVNYNNIINDFNVAELVCCEWAYNKTIKADNNVPANYMTYDCKLTNPSNVSLETFATTDIFDESKNSNRNIPYSIFFNIEPRVVTKSSGEYKFNGAVNMLKSPKVIGINDIKSSYYNENYEKYKDEFKWKVPVSVRTLATDDNNVYEDYTIKR